MRSLELIGIDEDEATKLSYLTDSQTADLHITTGAIVIWRVTPRDPGW